jgi:membrane-associated phospholipid phosphatase
MEFNINNILESSPIYFYFIKLYNTKYKTHFTYFIIFNSIINQILKRIIKEERPIPTNSYGMPSGHAQMMWFIVFYNMNEIKNIFLQIFLILSGLLISYDRVRRKKHTIKQVLVGSIIGSIFGTLVSQT